MGNAVSEDAKRLVANKQWADAAVALAAERTRLGDTDEVLALQARVYARLERFPEAVECLRLRVREQPIPDVVLDELASATLWSGDVAGALRRLYVSPVLKAELLVARVALGECVDVSLLARETLARCPGLATRLARAGLIGRALRVADAALQYGGRSDDALVAKAVALLGRGRESECREAATLLEELSPTARTEYTNYFYAMALAGTGRGDEALALLEHAAPSGSAKHTQLRAEIAAQLGRHALSAALWERCMGETSALLECVLQWIAAGDAGAAMRVYRTHFLSTVPVQWTIAQSWETLDQQRALTDTLKRCAATLTMLLPPLTLALLGARSVGDALEVARLWLRLAKHFKWRNDVVALQHDALVALCATLLHAEGDGALEEFQQAQTLLDAELRRLHRQRPETFSAYLKRCKNRQPIAVPDCVPNDAANWSEAELFNLLGWARRKCGDSSGADFCHAICAHACQLWRVASAPCGNGSDDALWNTVVYFRWAGDG